MKEEVIEIVLVSTVYSIEGSSRSYGHLTVEEKKNTNTKVTVVTRNNRYHYFVFPREPIDNSVNNNCSHVFYRIKYRIQRSLD